MGTCAEYVYYDRGCFVPSSPPTAYVGLTDDEDVGNPLIVGMGDPSAANCEEKGYTTETLYSTDGGQYGLCLFGDDKACDTWAYYREECDESNPILSSYCEENGGELTSRSVDWGTVEGVSPAEYQVCTIDGMECVENDYYSNNCMSEEDAATDEPTSTVGMPDPSATGCEDQGYTLSETLYTTDGDQYGLCLFGDDKACDTWKFRRGECDESNPIFSSYCAENDGFLATRGVDWGTVEGMPPAEYQVCTTGGSECVEYNYYSEDDCWVDVADAPVTTLGSEGLSNGGGKMTMFKCAIIYSVLLLVSVLLC